MKKALELATQFRDFVNRVGSHYDQEAPGHLLSFFVDFAQEPETRFISQTRGDHGMLMVTWAVISAWFAQRPEDFAGIRDLVTATADLRLDDLDRLPFPFDKEEWDDWVFGYLHGGT
ncbi:hypothetical protein Rhe02_47160 [Rhizocola hellebori]|uniref:Uncharacterized protein n=1 Tax=Rhizocola hellebori TaxID=1392758 RepID=A0A8J3QAY8_9ACTN|nr:hypothetical protein [Rhizocola hellebori]GIH06649.1 hypothetical protein Rhe02_47160 [Rhizocola hellebori]